MSLSLTPGSSGSLEELLEDGLLEGSVDESLLGSDEGSEDGSVLGSDEGSEDGSELGSVDGSEDGSELGSVEGSVDGSVDGSVLGSVLESLGSVEGSVEGSVLGSVEGWLLLGIGWELELLAASASARDCEIKGSSQEDSIKDAAKAESNRNFFFIDRYFLSKIPNFFGKGIRKGPFVAFIVVPRAQNAKCKKKAPR